VTVSKLLGLQQTLDQLDRLNAAIRDCRSNGEQIETERRRRAEKLQAQHRQTLRDIDKELAAGQSAARLAWQDRKHALQTRQLRRRDRIAAARQLAQRRRLDEISNEESRHVFRIQRELLQVGRDQETGKQKADAGLATFQKAWDEAVDGTAFTSGALDAAFRGYGSLHRLLTHPVESTVPLPESSAQPLLQQALKLKEEIDAALARFRRAPLPRLFSAISPWWLGGLALGAHAAAFFLLPTFTSTSLAWQNAVLSLGVTWVLLIAVHWVGGRLARLGAQLLARDITRARTWLEAAHHVAHGEHQQELKRQAAQAQTRSEELQRQYEATRAEAERRRSELKDRIEQRQARAFEANDRLLQNGVSSGQRALQLELAQLEEQANSRRTALETDPAAGSSGQSSAPSDVYAPIVRNWNEQVCDAYTTLANSATAVTREFPDWTDSSWDRWTPPQQFPAAAPLGYLEVDLAQTTGGLPVEPRFQLPASDRLRLPLLLTLPDQGSVVFESQEGGRDIALASLNNLVLRLLLAAPPGRVLFTILDPVGLGESFAGLMHLTDHEDRLVNRRIWTQPDHIEQRLADLNEHIEKVTQLYLRNEYRTIAEYNEQAGRIAEPYHFLVLADFPVNFSDLAVRRLLSIASSGPRCGVFTLVHWDTRRTAPLDFVPDDLRNAGIDLQHRESGFALANRASEGSRVVLESPPNPARETQLLQQVGRLSVDSNRVEMPFAQIAPSQDDLWTHETTAEVRVPVGVTGATKLQQLALGKGTRQHVLIAGKTGSGKSTLFHVLVTNLALWSSPEQVEFYLVDFKKGVEFKCYAVHRLPHARVVAIESDREFGLSVLQRVDEELHRRGDLFRQLGVQDLPGYLRARREPLPRTLLIIDEFQEFFTEDDRVSQTAALLLDRLVRQGRAFGIHVLLGSQTLGGAYTLARTTLGQMVIRIALQCNQADALLIMDDDNPAPRLLSRPGEAIYNDTSGAIEGNSPFQIVWLPEEERETWLKRIRRHAADAACSERDLVVFEGNAPADVRENSLLHRLLTKGPQDPVPPARLWLGAPNSIKGPTEIVLHRQNGNNLLVVGQNDEASLAILALGLVALAAQHPKNSARILLFDATPQGSPHRLFLEELADVLPLKITWVTNASLNTTMIELAEELTRRSDQTDAATEPTLYLALHHLQRFKGLRYEDDFAISLDDNAAKAPGAVLNRILTEGTHLGFHVLCVCDSFNNTSRFLSRKAISEFELRVLFQMSASDSASLMDDPRASTLGLHRAVLFNAQEGSMETFRPYALPDAEWLRSTADHLRHRS